MGSHPIYNFFSFCRQIEEQLRLKVGTIRTRTPQQKSSGSEDDAATEAEAEKESFIRRMTSKEVVQPTVTLTLLFFFQNWTGFVATIFYGVDIFTVYMLTYLSN